MATREVMPKWVPKISLLECKEEFHEPDAEPGRQLSLSSHSNLSEDLQLELEEVKRQLSQVQEVATEAAKRAKEAEQKMAREVKEQEERRAAARRLLEESQRKRRFQEAKAKAQALELPTPKAEMDSPRKANTPRTLAVPEGGNLPRGSPRGKLSSQSPKGLKNALKVKRELSRTRHDEVQAVKLAAEQRKKELEAILQQEKKEQETLGTLEERLSSAEAAKALLQVQLTTMTVHAERLAFEREDLRCRLLNTSTKVFVKQSPAYFESRGTVSRRVRRTFGFTFMVIVCMALVAYIKAFRLIDGHLELPIQKQRRSCEPKGVCWLRR